MANAPRVPTTPTFPEWLAQQTDRGDDVAEFAREVGRLDDFPDSGSRSIYEGYFETAQPAQQEAFARAYDEYEASPEPARDDDAGGEYSERPTSLR